MTHGAEPKYAPTPYAQWLKKRLGELGWQHQDLAKELVEKSEGRLGRAGADRLVGRVAHGRNVLPVNQNLLDRILGLMPPPSDAAAELREQLGALNARVVRLEKLLDDQEGRPGGESAHRPSR